MVGREQGDQIGQIVVTWARVDNWNFVEHYKNFPNFRPTFPQKKLRLNSGIQKMGRATFWATF
jgi:hypothetical protein